MNAPVTSFRVAMAQLDFLVGDIQGNTDQIIAAAAIPTRLSPPPPKPATACGPI